MPQDARWKQLQDNARQPTIGKLTAGFVLANGSMSSNQSGEGDIIPGHQRNTLSSTLMAVWPWLWTRKSRLKCLHRLPG